MARAYAAFEALSRGLSLEKPLRRTSVETKVVKAGAGVYSVFTVQGASKGLERCIERHMENMTNEGQHNPKGRGRRFMKRLLATHLLALVGILGFADAQAALGGALPLSTPVKERTRAELLNLLVEVQGQIEEIPAGARGAEAERLTSLEGVLQLLLLQSQLERLQRENTTLKAQVAGGNEAASGGKGEFSELEGRIEAVIAEQERLSQEMTKFAGDHASLLTSVVGAEEAEEAHTVEETHVVVEGDTLSGLAQTYLGSANLWPEFLEANPSIASGDDLLVGEALNIPHEEGY